MKDRVILASIYKEVSKINAKVLFTSQENINLAWIMILQK